MKTAITLALALAFPATSASAATVMAEEVCGATAPITVRTSKSCECATSTDASHWIDVDINPLTKDARIIAGGESCFWTPNFANALVGVDPIVQISLMSSAVTNGLDFALAGGYGYDYIGNGGNGRLDLLDKVSANAIFPGSPKISRTEAEETFDWSRVLGGEGTTNHGALLECSQDNCRIYTTGGSYLGTVVSETGDLPDAFHYTYSRDTGYVFTFRKTAGKEGDGAVWGAQYGGSDATYVLERGESQR